MTSSSSKHQQKLLSISLSFVLELFDFYNSDVRKNLFSSLKILRDLRMTNPYHIKKSISHKNTGKKKSFPVEWREDIFVLSMEPYKIPREVQVEDRIFGPITMRRLIILSIGGGITYFIWLKLGKSYGIGVWGIPTFLFGSLTLAWAFLEPLGMKFGTFLLRLLEFILHPKKLVFDKRFSQDVPFAYIEMQSKRTLPGNALTADEKTELRDEKKEKLKHLQDITPLLDISSRISPHSS